MVFTGSERDSNARSRRERIASAVDTGVDTFIMEIDVFQGNLDDIKRDVEFTRNLID